MYTIYIQNIHTKHDKTGHTWKHAWIHTNIKVLRLDNSK